MSGAILVGVGGLLLVATAAYYLYGVVARSNLGDLSYSMGRSSVMPEDAGTAVSGDQAGAAGGITPSLEGRGVGMPGPAQAASDEGLPAVDIQSAGDTAAAVSSDVKSMDAGVAGLGAPSGAPVLEAQPSGGVSKAVGAGSDSSGLGSPGAAVSANTTDGELALASPSGLAFLAVEGGDTPDPTRAVEGGGANGDVGRTSNGLAIADNVVASGGGTSGDDLGPAQVPDGGDDSSENGLPDVSLSQAGPSTAPSQADLFALIKQAEADATAQAIEASRIEAAEYSNPSSVYLDGDLVAAARIRIPAVRIDSDVKQLEVVSVDDGYAWENPKWVVGHIPTTARPGGQGEGWYFGHLQSPIRREGNVFLTLPEIPELLSQGAPVYIFLEADDRKYAYQVYKTDTVHEDDLRITDSGNQDITLVTCVPNYYYDHRLLVTAALVGVSES